MWRKSFDFQKLKKFSKKQSITVQRILGFLLDRRELELINRQKLRYPLAITEKDYFSALVSKIIYSSPLRNKLLFKGGTALHHCYCNDKIGTTDV